MRATTDPGEYGVSKHYFVHQETNESRWEEPDEPFWIFNAVLQAADPEYGLQQPGQTGCKLIILVDLPLTRLIFAHSTQKDRGRARER